MTYADAVALLGEDLAEQVRATVEAAPPLTDAQIARLADIFRTPTDRPAVAERDVA